VHNLFAEPRINPHVGIVNVALFSDEIVTYIPNKMDRNVVLMDAKRKRDYL